MIASVDIAPEITAVVTFRQYAKALRAVKRAEYHITVAESKEFYPDEWLRSWWFDILMEAAERDEIIAPSVARTLTDNERRDINRYGYSLRRYI